jgi:hypothetical protein
MGLLVVRGRPPPGAPPPPRRGLRDPGGTVPWRKPGDPRLGLFSFQAFLIGFLLSGLPAGLGGAGLGGAGSPRAA